MLRERLSTADLSLYLVKEGIVQAPCHGIGARRPVVEGSGTATEFQPMNPERSQGIQWLSPTPAPDDPFWYPLPFVVCVGFVTES